MDFSPEALGQAIRSLREQQDPAMSQEQLGRSAGYRAGAGVSISRVESGLTRPGPARLAAIALSLRATPEQLKDKAERLTDQINRDRGEGTAPGGGSTRGAKTGLESSTKARLKRVQEILDNRTTRVQELGEAFSSAHDSARDEFFMSFIEIADDVIGAEPLQLAGLAVEEDTSTGPGVEAQYRLKIASSGIAKALVGGAARPSAGTSAGSAAAYATFTGWAMLRSASTGAAISGPTARAATNATLRLFGLRPLAAGSAGVAGGTPFLTGIAAAPAALLAVGGLVWMTRRNRNQEAALCERLDEAEVGIASAQRGFDALVDVLTRATEILNYIAVHASHAFKKWRADLAPRPIAWPEMTPEQRQRYQDFITIAGCQLSVVSIGVDELMTTEGEQLEHLIEVANEVLTRAVKTVEALV